MGGLFFFYSAAFCGGARRARPAALFDLRRCDCGTAFSLDDADIPTCGSVLGILVVMPKRPRGIRDLLFCAFSCVVCFGRAGSDADVAAAGFSPHFFRIRAGSSWAGRPAKAVFVFTPFRAAMLSRHKKIFLPANLTAARLYTEKSGTIEGVLSRNCVFTPAAFFAARMRGFTQ